MQGLQVLGIGFSRLTAEGEVYGLAKLKEIEGVYIAAEAGATMKRGKSWLVMQNPHDVAIYLRTEQQGAQLTLATGGVEIKLVQPESP